jgi:hypothetical protein
LATLGDAFPSSHAFDFEELVNIRFGDERRRSKNSGSLALVTLAAHMLHQLSGPQRGPLRDAKPVESAIRASGSVARHVARPDCLGMLSFLSRRSCNSGLGQVPVSNFPFLRASIFLCIQYRNIPLFQE